MALVWGCAPESDPEAGGGTDDGVVQDAQEQCDEALDDPPQCVFPLGLRYVSGDAVANTSVVDLETSDAVVELEHALFVPPSEGPQLAGEPAVANDVCIVGCFLHGPEGAGACIVYADDGSLKCGVTISAGDVAGCESFAEACRN